MIVSKSVGKCDEGDHKCEKVTENDERRLSLSESELRVRENTMKATVNMKRRPKMMKGTCR